MTKIFFPFKLTYKYTITQKIFVYYRKYIFCRAKIFIVWKEVTLIAAERPLTHGNTHGQQRGEETAFKPCRALVPHRRGGSHHARPAKGRTIRDAPRRRRAELGPVLPRSCGSSAAGLEGCCLELGCPPQPSPAAVCPPCTAPYLVL